MSVKSSIYRNLIFYTVSKNYNFCTLNRDEQLFFTLVDYLNNYFTGDDPYNVVEFYNCFQNGEELIKWMKERPKGNCKIREIDGYKEIIIVIPTVDTDAKFARNCQESIFKGLHIIFMESGHNNFYFNFAHNCNLGLRKAMECNPKWVVVSNNDMYKIDAVSVLIDNLKLLDNNSYTALSHVSIVLDFKFINV